MGRILKASALGLGFLAYIWVAGVRNAEAVKSRKRARRAAKLVGANEREERQVERWTRAMIRYRWWVAGIWAALFLVGGYAASGLSDLLTNRFTLPGTDTARADSILEDHFGQKTVGSFTVVVKGEPGSAEQLLPTVRERAEAAANELPTGQLAGVQAGLGLRGQRHHRLQPGAGRREGLHGRHARRRRRDSGRDGLRLRAGRHRARPRPGLLARPSGRRALHRHPDRGADSRLRLRDARLPAAAHLRRGRDPDDARDHLALRARDGADDLPAEPRHAHRVRHCDRLLAPDRLPLPRGAPVAGDRRRTPSSARWRPRGARSSSAARRSGSASRSCSSCRSPSCAGSGSAGS